MLSGGIWKRLRSKTTKSANFRPYARELFPLVRRLCAETNVVGMELLKLNPLVDPTYVTLLVANRCAREMLTGVAMRKMGITEKHYLSPDTVDHGQG